MTKEEPFVSAGAALACPGMMGCSLEGLSGGAPSFSGVGCDERLQIEEVRGEVGLLKWGGMPVGTGVLSFHRKVRRWRSASLT